MKSKSRGKRAQARKPSARTNEPKGELNMSTADPKALSRRVIEEGFNQGNLAVIDQVYSPQHVNHDAPPMLPQGPAGVKQFIAMYRAAFPDLHTTVDDQIAEG